MTKHTEFRKAVKRKRREHMRRARNPLGSLLATGSRAASAAAVAHPHSPNPHRKR